VVKSRDDIEFEKYEADLKFAPAINKGVKESEIENVHAVKGMDKVMERMNKARMTQMEKKMVTERGMPSQLFEKVTKGERTMKFGNNTDKFKSGFGKNGSTITRANMGTAPARTVAKGRSSYASNDGASI
jgi:hypothetical protein